MIKILISACLLGERVRYDGRHALVVGALLDQWQNEQRLVPFCPEMAGGMPALRPPVEINGGGGVDVLAGKSRVYTPTGQDMTEPMVSGARKACSLAKLEGVGLAILKERSPSCGSTTIYDGSFSGRLIPGSGVAAASLRALGIEVFNELQLESAAAYLRELEQASRKGTPG